MATSSSIRQELYAYTRHMPISPDSKIPEACRDIFVTAVEGGINYWASVVVYEPDLCYARLVEAENVPDSLLNAVYIDRVQRDRAVADLDLPPDSYIHVDGRTIARGLLRIAAYLHVEDQSRLDDEYGAKIWDLFVTDEIGEIDAAIADDILQIGVFGDIVYG